MYMGTMYNRVITSYVSSSLPTDCTVGAGRSFGRFFDIASISSRTWPIFIGCFRSNCTDVPLANSMSKSCPCFAFTTRHVKPPRMNTVLNA